MTIVLLDTVIASLLHPGKRNADLRGKYTPYLSGKTLAISFQTVAELYLWAEQNKWGVQRRAALEGYIRSFLLLPFDLDLAREWAKVMNHARQSGSRLSPADAWIAATGTYYSLTLVTHDKDLARAKIPGLNVICYA